MQSREKNKRGKLCPSNLKAVETVWYNSKWQASKIWKNFHHYLPTGFHSSAVYIKYPRLTGWVTEQKPKNVKSTELPGTMKWVRYAVLKNLECCRWDKNLRGAGQVSFTKVLLFCCQQSKVEIQSEGWLTILSTEIVIKGFAGTPLGTFVHSDSLTGIDWKWWVCHVGR